MGKSKELEKFKELTLRQKIGYIRDYYTVHIIAVIIAVSAVGWTLNHYIFNPPPRTFVSISFYGQFVPDEFRMMVAENLTNSLVETGENYAVIIENFFISGEPQFDMAMSQRMVALVTARELDVIIIAPGSEEQFIETGFARDLREFVPAIDKTTNLPMSYFPIFEEFSRQFGWSFDGWTLIVMSNSERYEPVQTFFDYTLLFYSDVD